MVLVRHGAEAGLGVASYRRFAAAAVVLPWAMQSAQAASFTFKNIIDSRAASLPFMRFYFKGNHFSLEN
jgi:hypothetical protein